MAELRFEAGAFRVERPGGFDRRVEAVAGDVEAFGDWARRYDAILAKDDWPNLTAIGIEMRRWLDERDLIADLIGETGPIEIDFAAPIDPDAGERAFLDAPWELLCDTKGFFLAGDAERLYRPARRLGTPAQPSAPSWSDLRVAFMAAAPRGTNELDHEAEEAGVLEAVERLPVQVVVEESGALDFLAEQLARDAAPQVVHFSCHGLNSQADGACLALEDAVGEVDLAGAGRIVEAFGDAGRPQLVVLSACQSAEQVGTSRPLAFSP